MKLDKIVKFKADKKNNKEFKVKKERDSERDIVLIFRNEKKYEVDKLDSANLPATIPAKTRGAPDKKVVWLNNFQVKGEYVEGEPYSVLIPTIDGGQDIVWFDGENTLYYEGETKDTIYEDIAYKEITLTTGDPGAGWTTNN